MHNLHNFDKRPHPRWVLVRDTFAIGKTRAHELCESYSMNPDEIIEPFLKDYIDGLSEELADEIESWKRSEFQ